MTTPNCLQTHHFSMQTPTVVLLVPIQLVLINVPSLELIIIISTTMNATTIILIAKKEDNVKQLSRENKRMKV